VTGFASAEAEQVRVFYTRSAAAQVRDSASWTQCANVTPSGGGAQGVRFEADCQVVAGDVATGVTGIAAVAIDCHSVFGCQSSPVDTRVLESGDAHRVFGFASDALLALEPAEAEGQVESCQRMTLVVQDQTGQPIEDADVDIHLSGPSDQVNFCDVEDTSARTAPDQGSHTGSESDESVHADPAGNDTHHTEGNTGGQGRFVFGVSSEAAGTSTILAWADVEENDEPGLDERGDTAAMHWIDPAKEPPSRGGCTKVGTAGKDVLIGTKGKDKLCGKGGNDILRGRGGNDVLLGGRGNDRVIGGKGRDKLRGGGGRDALRAAQGKDTLSGGRGRDRLNGGGRRDDCDGGVGRDKFKKCERKRR
jgi:hypothetical protein